MRTLQKSDEENEVIEKPLYSLYRVFPIDDESRLELRKIDNGYDLVYSDNDTQLTIAEGEDASEPLINVFGTDRFEIIRKDTLVKVDSINAYHLRTNKNQLKHYSTRTRQSSTARSTFTQEKIKDIRKKILKQSIEDDPSERKKALIKALEKDGISLNQEEKEKLPDIRLSDSQNTVKEKLNNFMDSVRNNENLLKLRENLSQNSHSFLEGFLSFYGLEIEKREKEKEKGFDIVEDENGASIQQIRSDGQANKISPYFERGEAKKKLEELKAHMQLQQEIQRQNFHEYERELTLQKTNGGEEND